MQRVFGLSYLRDFELTSTLVTFFTTGLASALVFLLLYRLAKQTTGSRARWPVRGRGLQLRHARLPLLGGSLPAPDRRRLLLRRLLARLLETPRRATSVGSVRPWRDCCWGWARVYSFASLPMGLCLAALLPVAARAPAQRPLPRRNGSGARPAADDQRPLLRRPAHHGVPGRARRESDHAAVLVGGDRMAAALLPHRSHDGCLLLQPRPAAVDPRAAAASPRAAV